MASRTLPRSARIRQKLLPDRACRASTRVPADCSWSSTQQPSSWTATKAHVLGPYTVQNLTDRLVVTVRNGNIPVPLSLRPDGVLTGSGTIDVVGRVVTGTNADGVTYAPRTARCNVDALSPK